MLQIVHFSGNQRPERNFSKENVCSRFTSSDIIWIYNKDDSKKKNAQKYARAKKKFSQNKINVRDVLWRQLIQKTMSTTTVTKTTTHTLFFFIHNVPARPSQCNMSTKTDFFYFTSFLLVCYPCRMKLFSLWIAGEYGRRQMSSATFFILLSLFPPALNLSPYVCVFLHRLRIWRSSTLWRLWA